MTRATVITDASFCFRTKAAGWAAWVVVDGNRVQRSGPLQDCPDAETAEMKAALNGVFIATSKGATEILLQSDCMAVVGVLSGRKGKWRKARKRWRPLQSIAFPNGIPGSVTARHVKGHTKVEDARSHVNRWCDRQAKNAMRSMRGAL